MFVRVNEELGDRLLCSFVVVNMIRLKLENVLGFNTIFRMSYEMRAIFVWSRLKYSCTEWATLTIIGWFFIF